MNEQETRTNLILPAIQEAGWGKIDGSHIREEFSISKGRLIGNRQRSKPDKADYVLQYRNRNLAVIEAKPVITRKMPSPMHWKPLQMQNKNRVTLDILGIYLLYFKHICMNQRKNENNLKKYEFSLQLFT
ncbi:MAG: hypothetical protein IIB95_10620 [Candidatus Marinimicrobia bacterium]|nr:hypothetical protein [Candidatus Neomarinimicrobiota bacterium]